MKYVTTIICCLAFAFAGIGLAISGNNTGVSFSKHQTLSAATLSPMEMAKLPYDLRASMKDYVQMDQDVKRDTIHDTMYIDRPEVLVINKKSSRVSSPKKVTDYAWMVLTPGQTSKDTVNNKGTPNREEDIGENSICSSKGRMIRLIVDGEIVYSENVNHSTGESQQDYCGSSQSGTCLAHFRWVSLAQVRNSTT